MKEEFLRETIARVGPKGTETGGPDSVADAGKDVAGAVDAYRRNDREALERHLRSAATYGALRLLDRRAATGGAETNGDGVLSGDDGIVSVGGSSSDTGAETDSDGDGSAGVDSAEESSETATGESADGTVEESTEATASDSGLLTLPRVALVALVGAVGYVLVSRYRSERRESLDDPLLDETEPRFAGGADEDTESATGSASDREADDTAAEGVDVDTPNVTSEAAEGDGKFTDEDTGATASIVDAEEGEHGNEDGDDDPRVEDEVETVDEVSDEDAEPGEIVAEEEVVEEVADEHTDASDEDDTEADADIGEDETDDAEN